MFCSPAKDAGAQSAACNSSSNSSDLPPLPPLLCPPFFSLAHLIFPLSTGSVAAVVLRVPPSYLVERGLRHTHRREKKFWEYASVHEQRKRNV
eukprot:139653-Rhodomonas_salina.1